MSTTLHKPALLCALLASGCVTELDVDPLVPLEPTVAATYDEQAVDGTKLKVKMQDKLWDAVVTCDSPNDPKNEVIRKDA